MNKLLEAIIGLMVVALIYIFLIRDTTTKIKSPYDNNVYNVHTKYDNNAEVILMFSRVNSDILKLLKHLRIKYLSPESDGSTYIKTAVTSVLYRYNPEVLYENEPLGTTTSFTVYKGAKMHICARQKYNPNELVAYPVLQFVVLHELAHIAAFDAVDHPPRFWSVFKFILQESIAAGIYKPVDFKNTQTPYCGMYINYNPLFDNSVISAEKLNLQPNE